jgi:hypothetical protein
MNECMRAFLYDCQFLLLFLKIHNTSRDTLLHHLRVSIYSVTALQIVHMNR